MLASKSNINSSIRENANKTEEFRQRFLVLKSMTSAEMSQDKMRCIETIIMDLLEFYAMHKHDITDKKIIYNELPDLCYKYGIENSEIIYKLLKCINDLPSIAVPHVIMFLLLHCCEHKTNPQLDRKYMNQQKKAVFSYLSYYLYHAYKMKLCLDNKPILETIPKLSPALFSNYLFFADYRSVLVLLQFGLRFQSNYLMVVHPIFFSAAEQLSWYTKQLLFMQSNDPKEEIIQKCYLKGFLRFHKNFQLLLLSTYSPQTTLYDMPFIMKQHLHDLSVRDVRNQLKYMFPNLDFHRNEPPSLQHVSRWVIREALAKKWKLPFGVWELPIPRFLQKYLNFID